MHKSRILLSILFSFGSIFMLQGQSTGSSPYSRYGIGDTESFGFARSLAMGGVGVALQAPFEINSVNPASYAVYKFPENSVFELLGKDTKKPNGRPFVFQVGTRADRTDRFSETESQTNYGTNLVSISGRFQLQNYWSASFGMLPISSVGYSVSNDDSVSLGDYTSSFSTDYTGSGGLTSIYIGNAFYYKGLSLGVNASYIFGPIDQNTYTFLQDDKYISATNDLKRIHVSDFDFRYGLQYTNDSIFGKFGLTLGAYYQNKADMNAVYTQYTTRAISNYSISLMDTLRNDTIGNGTIGMPAQYGFGLALQNKNFCVTADYTISDWTDVLFLGNRSDALSKGSKIAFGAEYTPNPTSKRFFETVSYRIGGHTGQSYLIFNGEHPSDVGLSIGFGFPVVKSMTKLNISFEAGKFGSTNNNLIQENYYRINLFFNSGDLWFQKRRFK